MTLPGLRIVQDDWHQRLSFALRFDDHFLDRPVDEELAVALMPGNLPPLKNAAGNRRNDDGTYRYRDLSPGSYQVIYSSPSGRYQSWSPPLSLVVPFAGRAQAVATPLWPSPRAPLPAATTAVRGQLVPATPLTASLTAVKVELRETAGAASGKFAVTGADHEFVYLFAERFTPNATTGLVSVTATLTMLAGGAPRTVNSVSVIGTTTVTYPGSGFKLKPGVASRVKLTVA